MVRCGIDSLILVVLAAGYISTGRLFLSIYGVFLSRYRVSFGVVMWLALRLYTCVQYDLIIEAPFKVKEHKIVLIRRLSRGTYHNCPLAYIFSLVGVSI
ncbi:hypothetical protein BDV96DRAFT_582899 [Lophiotrema nucula]|uniref:Uncharacterized protein n=1 Tax=Lophiotrema nucula TaxID=690887 RepID=A0A6A5YUS7_9PLEO|nr:hypothetical protein BDV96DRAFT_582899 [Lophiotrema nucula]